MLSVCQRQSLSSSSRLTNTLCQQHWQQHRAVSSSPYGRTHVWKRRAPVLPNPVVPKFPQKVIRSDGTSYVQWTTSPKSLARLTRDTTNNPMYNPALASGSSVEEESGTTGRLGRFTRRFEGLGVQIDESAFAGESAIPLKKAKKEAPAAAPPPAAGKKGKS
ncbi:hypothetical protein FA15DRAFT_301159 [Coprinopsis marcescibilis]|uniref:50S ribosomal protein L36 n=1 Tax=Coprinopsis marcescibilis TaxID=230819 RepID=A0A5C3KCZ4_COPMA|nr:hypothetical protein FA15DRAFT_301159 [Coprinopsis marcescibilis]